MLSFKIKVGLTKKKEFVDDKGSELQFCSPIVFG